MGTDVDEMLAYQTPKVVTIKDRTLGMLKYTFMFIIICYVFIFQLLYKGSHFQLQPHSGIARMQLQHPTKQCSPMQLDCSANYTSLKKLPYCNQYTGKSGNPTTKKECKYFDALDLLTPMDGGYLMPTFIETYDQAPGCKPSAKNNYKCDKKYAFVDGNGDIQTGSGRAKPKAQFFVADLESFTLLIDHSFRVETGTVEYDDFKMQGYWLDCSNEQWTLNSTWLSTGSHCVKKPIICAHKDCGKMGMVTASGQTAGKPRREHGRKGKRAGLVQSKSAVGALSLESGSLGGATHQNMKSDPEMYSLAGGDVFSIRTLYEMAGRSLDDWWYDPSDKRNMTIRQRGTVLVVNIHYNNLQPWTLFRPQDPPEYVMSVTSRPVEKYKHIRADASGGRTRELTMEYGTLVMVQSSSSIGVFKMIHMLIVVSTSFGLLAASSVLTDLLAVYVLPLRNEYSKAKYEETKDFHDFHVEHEETCEAESERT